MLSFMEADRTRLAQVEAQILDLERSLEALRVEKKVVQERLHSYKYPVFTLPNEILSEILVQVLPPYPICPAPFGILSPISLAHICRKWREVALTTPALWRAIRLLDYPFPYGLPGRRFEVWIDRSGSLPLSIIIDIGRDQILPAAYPAIFYSRARWEHVILRAYPSSLPPFDGPMSLLRHLVIAPKGVGSFEFHDVPQLRTVVLHSFISSTVMLPWHQLTSLTMEVEPKQWGSILQQTTNLVHCDTRLTFLGLGGGEDDPGSDITLPCLESLVFQITAEDHGIRYLDALTVPALRSLDVPERCLGQDPIGYLTSFIARSRCRLQILTIDRRTVSEKSYRLAFLSIPKFAFNDPDFAGSSDEEDSGSEDE
ncbi:hypothetical protein B0H12DRAFT_711184 [Mycena haematopus]|nr:hypothetical protein B0H12DRAFT_711184 [Mycena haematopus]